MDERIRLGAVDEYGNEPAWIEWRDTGLFIKSGDQTGVYLTTNETSELERLLNANEWQRVLSQISGLVEQ